MVWFLVVEANQDLMISGGLIAFIRQLDEQSDFVRFYDPNKPTMLYFHGWTGQGMSLWDVGLVIFLRPQVKKLPSSHRSSTDHIEENDLTKGSARCGLDAPWLR